MNHLNNVIVSIRHRKNRGVIESLSSWVFGQRMDNYSTVELHAEIYYAEANLLLSFLTFIQVSIAIVHMLDLVFNLVGTGTRSDERAPLNVTLELIAYLSCDFTMKGRGQKS